MRRPFSVRALQVTPLNMEELADWSGGEVIEDGEKGEQMSRKHIKIKTKAPREPRHAMAYPGDWIVKSGNSWKVYPNGAFTKNFIEEA